MLLTYYIIFFLIIPNDILFNSKIFNITSTLQNIPQIRHIAHQHQRTGPALQALSTQHAQPQKHCRTKRYIGIKVKSRRKGNVDNQRRQELAAYYYAHIHNPLIKLPNRLPDTENVYHIFPVLCERRDELQAFLLEHGIQTMIHYPIPPHKQACYAAWNTCSYPITERIHATELSLPLHQALTNDEAAQIVRAVNAFK